MGGTTEKLRAAGVETLAIIASPHDRARAYLRFHPARVPLAADPDLVSHLAFGLPRPAFTNEMEQAIATNHVALLRERTGQEVPLGQASAELHRLDGYDGPGPSQGIYTGQFLIDRHGLIRWASIECERDGLVGVGHMPSDEELLAAAQLFLA